MRTAARALFLDNVREVVRAIAKHRNGMLAKRREHELALFAVGHRLASLRVDDLPQEVVFGDMLHIARSRDTRPKRLGP